MSLEYWNNPQMESDTSHCGNLEYYNGEGSTLAKQPQRGSPAIDVSLRYTPYPTFARRVRIFKNIATVPDITLNYAQMEGVTPLGTNLTLFPLFSDLAPSRSQADIHFDTPPLLSSTPTSVSSDLSPITTSEQISNLFLPISYPLSPLPPDSLCLSDDAWNVSPISTAVDLPSLDIFANSPNEPEFHRPDNNLREALSSSILATDSVTDTKNGTVVLLDDDEKLVVKRRRHLYSGPELKSLSVSLSTPPRGSRTAKKALEDAKATAARIRRKNKGPTRSHPSDLSKNVMELSSDDLKLSPSITDDTSPRTSYSSLPSLSPSATPELSNVRKRKREMTSPLATPLQSPLPARLLSVDCSVDALIPSSSASIGLDEETGSGHSDLANDYIHRDFMTARAMTQRRSERNKAPISYAGCDEDIPERQVRGKSTVTKARSKSDEFKAQVPRMLQKKGYRNGQKRPHRVITKCECPFRIICPIPFGRFSDVVRHLESNVLHTHAEKDRWECPDCGSRLARSDSYKRHVNARACGKRASTGKVKPIYSAEVERELERIRNSDHPAILAAKERL